MTHPMPVSREQLHAEVWADPVAEVAKRYSVSGSFLARVCKRLNVPCPPRGYWAAVKGGRTPSVSALPPAHPGDKKEWTPGGGDGLLSRVPTATSASTAALSNVSPKRHPLLFGAEDELASGRPTKTGYLRPTRQLFPDIVVSPEQLKRTLSLASRLYNELEARGLDVRIAAKDSGLRTCGLDHRVDLTPRTMENSGPSYPIVQAWRPLRPTVVFSADVAIALTVYELSEYVSVYNDWLGAKQYIRKPDGYERCDMPCGMLAIRVASPYLNAGWAKVWQEKERGDLIAQLPTIADLVVRAAPDIAKLAADGERKRIEDEQRWEESQRRWDQERVQAAASAQLEASRAKLADLIVAWRRSRDLEDFLEAAAREVSALDTGAREVAEQQLAKAREALAPVRAVEVLQFWSQPSPRGFNIPGPNPG